MIIVRTDRMYVYTFWSSPIAFHENSQPSIYISLSLCLSTASLYESILSLLFFLPTFLYSIFSLTLFIVLHSRDHLGTASDHWMFSVHYFRVFHYPLIPIKRLHIVWLHKYHQHTYHSLSHRSQRQWMNMICMTCTK